MTKAHHIPRKMRRMLRIGRVSGHRIYDDGIRTEYMGMYDLMTIFGVRADEAAKWLEQHGWRKSQDMYALEHPL